MSQESEIIQETGYLSFHVQYSDGKTLDLQKPWQDQFIVGRRSNITAKNNDIFLDDYHISRRHCRLYFDINNLDKSLMVEDLDSKTGTRLNGVAVLVPTPIHVGHTLHIGTTRLTLLSIHNNQESFQARKTEDQKTIDFSGNSISVVDPSFDGETDRACRGSMMAIPADLPASEDADTIHNPIKPDKQRVSADTDDAEPEAILPADDVSTIHAPPYELLREDQTLQEDPSTVKNLPDGREAGQSPSTWTDNIEGATIQGTSETLDNLNHEIQKSVHTSISTVTLEPSSNSPHPTHTILGLGIDTSDQEEEDGSSGYVSPLLRDFIKLNFLDHETAHIIQNKAQNTGNTVLHTLAHEQTVRYLDEIFSRVSQKYKFDLIADEEYLQSLAWAPKWMPFNRAEMFDIVMLRPEHQERNRYATLDPFNIAVQERVERLGGKPARPILVLPDVYHATLRRLKNRNEEDANEVGIAVDITLDDEILIREQVGQVDIPQMVNYFLHRAQSQGASDIHIEPTEELLLIRNRVDGILHEEISLPSAFHPEVVSRLKIMSRMDVAEKRRPQDGRFRVIIGNNPIDVRVSSYPTVFGEKFVLRLLDPNSLRPAINTMGMLDNDLMLLKDKLNAPFGMIIISGPTGSGKTTTLYSCLSSLDKASKNVLTVEDPVEYRLKGIHQMQANSKIGLTFASGLRTILRQDPDVIMVGEIRDNETAEMAVQAALTGHIVFSTIHANDSIGVITRLLDMKIEPFLVASALSLAIAQRLVRKICPHCHKAVSGEEILRQLKLKEGISPERLELLGIDIDPQLEYAQGTGCSRCRSTGYLGRQAVFEIFDVTDESRNLIMSPDFHAGSLRKLTQERGMSTLIGHGIKLVEDETTTFSEVIRVLG
ncbi:MAG: Flp pilus assembly complex ATPase component TadA, partial [Magnetococcales bacterium]|nr:Flp pilus assembly complex ATPase component TadA [Magnetococcales bacterium]